MNKLVGIIIALALVFGILLLIGAFFATGDSIIERIAYFVVGSALIVSVFSSTVRHISSLVASLLGLIYTSLCYFSYSNITLFTYIVCLIIAIFTAIHSIQTLCERHSIRFVFTSNHAQDALETSEDLVVTSTEDLCVFLSSHTLVDQIYTKVAGVSYNNEDGTSRQDILRLCCAGDEIALEYFEYKGSPAYAVYTQHGQIGNLPADISKTIDRQYSGCIIQGTIRFRTGGYDGLYFGCELLLKVYKENTSITNSALDTDTAKPHDKPVYTANEFTPSTSCPPFRVDDKFIAEAQWYAARGGVDLTEDD